MNFILISILFLSFSLFADEVLVDLQIADESTKEASDIIEVKDTSGLSDAQVREIANKKDASEKKVEIKATEIIKKVVDRDDEGNVDITKLQKSWAQMSPSPKAYDWLQTKSGEWFKGKIKALYKDKLEFDSDEIGLYTFKFKNIKQIKSYNIISVNIEDTAIVTGIIRFKNDEMTIIQGDSVYKFNRSQIISLAPDGEREISYWSAKISISMDIRQGNKEQYDYAAKASVKRRTSDSALYLDYLGRISSRDNIETANDHRINQKYDRFITKSFFWTPVFSEYYQDKFQNIQNQITVGIGIGYAIVDNNWAKWDVSAGPAYTYIEYLSVEQGSGIVNAYASDISTKVDLELTKKVDFKYDYKITITSKDAGSYRHHMVSTLENKLTNWLDLDFSFIWDYVLNPGTKEDGKIPRKSDYQFLIGLGIEF